MEGRTPRDSGAMTRISNGPAAVWYGLFCPHARRDPMTVHSGRSADRLQKMEQRRGGNEG